jgi:hypothetical protein
MKMARLLASTAAVFIVGLLGRPARAYPQFVFKGNGDCGSCHHSPSGGGFPNRWGRESLDVTFGKDWGAGPVNHDLAYDPATPTDFALDLGADIRLMPLFESDGDASLGTVIPMLTEIGGAVSLGRFIAYGGVTADQVYGVSPSYVIASREHWLGYRAASGVDVRAGRLVLPFGIRQPDHTQYVREDFGFDKWQQSYGAEVDIRRETWSLFANAFAGDLTRVPEARQERGIVLTPLLNFEGGAAIGMSVLGSTSSARTRVAVSLFGRAPLGGDTYVMGEVAVQHLDAKAGPSNLSTIAEYVRLGWFARPAMDVFLEAGQRAFLNADGLTKGRLGLGLNWQLFNWFEFAPQVLAEARTGLPSRVLGMAQLHFVY